MGSGGQSRARPGLDAGPGAPRDSDSPALGLLALPIPDEPAKPPPSCPGIPAPSARPPGRPFSPAAPACPRAGRRACRGWPGSARVVWDAQATWLGQEGDSLLRAPLSTPCALPQSPHGRPRENEAGPGPDWARAERAVSWDSPARGSPSPHGLTQTEGDPWLPFSILGPDAPQRLRLSAIDRHPRAFSIGPLPTSQSHLRPIPPHRAANTPSTSGPGTLPLPGVIPAGNARPPRAVQSHLTCEAPLPPQSDTTPHVSGPPQVCLPLRGAPGGRSRTCLPNAGRSGAQEPGPG